MVDPLVTLVLSIITLVSSLLALEIKNMTRSVIFLWITAVTVGVIFFSFGAYYSAIFQWVVYGGVLAMLFLTFVALVESSEKETTKSKKESLTLKDMVGERESER